VNSIYEKVKKGLPLDDVFILDAHSHIGKWFNFDLPYGSAESMLVTMDALGVDMACVTADSSCTADYVHGNDLAIDAAVRFPDRFMAYCTVNPNYPEDMKNELDRCFRYPGVKGIKIHAGCHLCPIDFKNYKAAYEMADERKLPVLIHVWGRGDVAEIDRLAGRYPGALFIMGHSGAEVRAMEDAVDVINRHDNCYADLAISLAREGNVEWLVREVGSKKVTYGTDMPFFDPKPVFGRIAFAEISDDDKKNIFGANLKKAFRL
jgi:uncharacterized protein